VTHGSVVVSGADSAPWFPNMAVVMARDFDLLDELATAWAVDRDRDDLPVEDFLSLYLPDEVVGRELDPNRAALPFENACWLMFLHGYWGGVKLGRRFRRVGAARGAEESGLAEPRVPQEADLDAICAGIATVAKALSGGRAELLRHLDASLRTSSQTGTLYGTAYNTGFFEPLLFHPPEGALPPHLTANPDYVVCAEDRLLAIEYQVATPAWLTHHKQCHAAAREAFPQRWEEVVVGTDDGSDLRDLWRQGFQQGAYNWGGETVANWKQTTLDPFLYASARFNMQLEAISHLVLATLTDPTQSDLMQAARATALFVPSWLGTAIGVSDELGERPEIVRS
jgi:hypothetical protein